LPPEGAGGSEAAGSDLEAMPIKIRARGVVDHRQELRGGKVLAAFAEKRAAIPGV
jgi:hypothetical protein